MGFDHGAGHSEEAALARILSILERQISASDHHPSEDASPLRRADSSVLALVGQRSFDNPLLVRTHTRGLESGRKVDELNYRRIDFQDMAETSKRNVRQLLAYSVQKLPPVIILVM